jgi:hypothetical protein
MMSGSVAVFTHEINCMCLILVYSLFCVPIYLNAYVNVVPTENVKQEFTELVEDFISAWNLVHMSLINFGN